MILHEKYEKFREKVRDFADKENVVIHATDHPGVKFDKNKQSDY